MVEMTCSVCGASADTMAVYKGKVYCFSCLVDKFPDVVSRLVSYLTEFKRVK